MDLERRRCWHCCSKDQALGCYIGSHLEKASIFNTLWKYLGGAGLIVTLCPLSTDTNLKQLSIVTFRTLLQWQTIHIGGSKMNYDTS